MEKWVLSRVPTIPRQVRASEMPPVIVFQTTIHADNRVSEHLRMESPFFSAILYTLEMMTRCVNEVL
jgi:hypothetical protein